MDNKNQERIKSGNDELIGKGTLDVVDDLFTTDYLVHTGGKEYKGHAFIRRWIRQLRSAIPDIKVVKIEFYIRASDTIVWQRTLCGTHKANMMGIPPTGQKVEWRDMMVSRFVGEKIAEEWAVSELAGELLSKMPID